VIAPAQGVLSGQDGGVSDTPSVQSGRARSSGSLVVPAALDELPDVIKRAVAGSRQFSVDKSAPGSVELYRRTNWFTWGETLSADFSAVDDSHTLVTVRSRPTFRLQVQDWGQSQKDVAALLDALSSVASGTPSPLAGGASAGEGSATRSGNKLIRQLPIAICLTVAAASVVVGALLLAQH
jgi:hypothetical protein